MAKKNTARNKSCRSDYFMLTGSQMLDVNKQHFCYFIRFHLHNNSICLLVDRLLLLNNLQINTHSSAGDDQDPLSILTYIRTVNLCSKITSVLISIESNLKHSYCEK